MVVMNDIFSNAFFGIFLSVLAFEVGTYIYKKTKLAFLNPLLMATIIVCGFLVIFRIDYKDFNVGGKFITLLLYPATVVLAIPLYNNLHILKKNYTVIFIGLVIGCIISILSICMLSIVFGFKKELLMSLLPKSITTPIAVELSAQIGGIPSITIIAVLIAGVFGAVFSPTLCKLFKIKDRIAIGLAIGTTSHALGTTRAFELGEIEGAMSSLAIGISGITTVIITPLLLRLLLPLIG